MSNDKCDVVRDLLPIYVDDVCSDESRRIVSEHLESCAECRQFYENMSKHIESEVSDTELDSKQAFRAIKKKWYLKAGIIALYFLPVIISIVFYGTLALVIDLGFIGVSELCAIGALLISAILMLKKKWWGCFFGIAPGVMLIYMSFQYTGQVIDIERPLGIIMCLYYAILGFLLYKKWRYYE